MNARVLLLILTTGLFMAAWDGDQAAMQVAIAKRMQQRAIAVAAAEPTVPDERTELADHRHSLTALTVETSRPAVAGHRDVPLPPGIAAGQYHAVNQFGETQMIEVSARAATGTNIRDFHLVDAQDGSRWYLIRIEQP